VLEILQSLELLPRERLKATARLCEHHTSSAAAQQFHTEEFFKLLDLPAEKALPRWIAPGRLRHSARFGHTAEALQPIKRQPALREQFLKHDWTVITHAVIRLEETGK
jgi:hypothetical protein